MSRIVVAAALAVVAACSSDVGTAGPAPGTTVPSPAPAESGAAEPDSSGPGPPATAVTATVTRVPDGDSFDVRIDGSVDEVRLIGLNANEGDECFGDEAGDHLRGLIEGREIGLDLAPERDDFGRLLAYAFVDDQSVNASLVAGGWAVARDQSGHPLAEEYEALEAAAREAGLGLWAPDACGEPATGEVRIVDVVADAPGPDNENPNGEWVDIVNVGNETVDLAGWVVKDESTRHRYEFAAGTVLEPGAAIRLFSGCGDDGTFERYWCKVDDSVWNNSGDTAFLLDPNGSAVDTFPY